MRPADDQRCMSTTSALRICCDVKCCRRVRVVSQGCLKKASSGPRRWLVVAFHEPYYTTQSNHTLGTYFQLHLEDVLYENAVDLVVTGHVHAYKRTFPVYKGQVSVFTEAFEALFQGTPVWQVAFDVITSDQLREVSMLYGLPVAHGAASHRLH